MKTMKYIFTLLLPALLLSGCMKEDIDELREQQAGNAARIAALEAWQQTVNTNITALQGLVTALESKDFVTGVVPKIENGVEVGFTITFTKSTSITIYHGKKGDKGDTGTGSLTPVIGVKQDTDGNYYWTYQVGDEPASWMLDGSGRKLPATGTPGKSAYELAVEKGYSGTLDEWLASLNGTDGIDGIDGIDGKSAYELAVEKGYTGTKAEWIASLKGEKGDAGTTPQIRINTLSSEWEISTDGGASWTPTGVKATGDKGDKGDKGDQGDAIFAANGIDNTNTEYVVFTLADGTTRITLPKYKPIGITFAVPAAFAPGEMKEIPYKLTGAATIVVVTEKPSGWIASVNRTTGMIKITAPVSAAITDDNGYGEIVLLISDGGDRVVLRTADVNITGAVSNEIGSLYYFKGEVAGLVIRAKTPTKQGLVVYKNESSSALKWYTGQYVESKVINKNDGKANLKDIQMNYNLPDYPALTWCNNLNTTPSEIDWYLPAENELLDLYAAFNGSSSSSANNIARNTFNAKLITIGGTELKDSGFNESAYWCSTQSADGFVNYIVFETGKTFLIVHSNLRNVRAVLAF